jgi:hypothetical protein
MTYAIYSGQTHLGTAPAPKPLLVEFHSMSHISDNEDLSKSPCEGCFYIVLHIVL